MHTLFFSDNKMQKCTTLVEVACKKNMQIRKKLNVKCVYQEKMCTEMLAHIYDVLKKIRK